MGIQKIWNPKGTKTVRTKLAAIASMAAIIPALTIVAAIQQAAALSVSAAFISSDFCTSSTSDQTVLSVTVSNTNTKDMLSTPTGYIQTFGANNLAVLTFKLKSSTSTVDRADMDAQASDLRDNNAGLSWYSTTSSAKTVTIRASESTDTVCAIANQNELLVYY